MQRLWRPAVGHPVSWVRYAVLRAMIARSPRQNVEGLEASDLIASGRTELLFAKLGAALGLIASVDPPRFARLTRDLRRVVFLESGPEYWPEARACVLNDVADLSAAEVALRVVHEAAHARLWNAGFRYGPDVRARIERICVSAELAFVRKLPESAQLVEETERKLEQEWWAADRRAERVADDLRQVGAPAWMQRLHERHRNTR